MQGEKYVLCESGDQQGEWDNKTVAFFFVHCLHNNIQCSCDGWDVPVVPVGQNIFVQASVIEHIWTSCSHDAMVML